MQRISHHTLETKYLNLENLPLAKLARNYHHLFFLWDAKCFVHRHPVHEQKLHLHSAEDFDEGKFLIKPFKLVIGQILAA